MPEVYLLHGLNSVELDERVRKLQQDIDPAGMGGSALDLAASSLDQVKNACHAAPFFGGRRAVLLKNAGVAGKRNSGGIEMKDLIEVITGSPGSTSILLRFDETVATNAVVMKAAKQHKWRVESFPMPRGEDLARWVAERARIAGAGISRNAAVLLLSRLYPTSWRQESRFETTSLDARLIVTEVEKLAIAAGGGDIDEALVEELVADRSGYTAFRLNDLIYNGQTDHALVELEQVLASGDEPERVIAQFAGESAGLAAARALPEFDLASVAKASGISEGRLKMLRQKPASRNETGLRNAAEKLRQAEWTVKTGRAPRGEAVIVATAAEVAEGFRRSRGNR